MISNRQGFEYAELGPQKLPGSPPSYLDVSPSAGADHSYGFELLDVDGGAFIRYSRYRRIMPNDSDINRGAYLSIGFVASRTLSMHAAARCIDLVSQMYGHIGSFIGADDRVSTSFKLPSYSFDGGPLEDASGASCSALLLVDLLMQAQNAEGPLAWTPRKPFFVDPACLGSEEEIDKHLFFFKRGAPGAQLRLDREREKLKRLTQKLVLAASRADQVQDEWLAYQSLMQAHLPSVAQRGTELRELIDEIERLTQAVDSFRAPKISTKPRAAPPAGSTSSAAYPYGATPSQRQGSGVYRPRVRGLRRTHRPHEIVQPRYRRVVIGIGSVIAVAVVASLLQLFGGRTAPDVAVGPASTVPSPGASGSAERTPVDGSARGAVVGGSADASAVDGTAEPSAADGSAEASAVSGTAEASAVDGSAEGSPAGGSAEGSAVGGAAEGAPAAGAARGVTVDNDARGPLPQRSGQSPAAPSDPADGARRGVAQERAALGESSPD